jgi:diacylglycerol kinase
VSSAEPIKPHRQSPPQGSKSRKPREQGEGKLQKPYRQSLPQSFICALRGIAAALGRERNLKIQLVCATLALIAGFFLSLSALEWCVLIILVAVVLAAEMLNGAIESAIDLACPGHDERARLAKDVAAGAVLLLSAAAAVVGILLYSQAIIRMINAMGR